MNTTTKNNDSNETAIAHPKFNFSKDNKKIKSYKNKKRNIIIIITISSIILILLVVFLLIYFFYWRKKDNEGPEENKNSIKAAYQATEGKKIKLFNYENINSEDYKVTLLNNQKSFRRLKIINEPEFIPEMSQNIPVMIEFKKSLNSVESLFENITELKNIDLSNFDMSEITNMDSMFSGCSSLEDIIFSKVDTKNVKSMNYLFKNCINLKKVDMSSFNSQNLENMNSIFTGCGNISLINISSFLNVEEDLLNGVNSKVDVISNERIYNKLNKISLDSIKSNINIIIIIDINDKDCDKGENEKCKTCSSLIKGNCLLCNEGYYLSIDSRNKKICSSCNKNPHCKKCIGASFYVLCQECEEGYILKNNECHEISLPTEQPEENNCITGMGEKCLSCQTEKGKKNQCLQCNEGFYLPTDSKDKNKCETCKKIGNCISCSGLSNSPVCNKCEIGYKLISNECKEISCIKGEDEKCFLCNSEPNKKDECLMCNDGYFIPDNALDKTKCSKCEIDGCKKCTGELGKQKCIECINYPFYANGEIQSCNNCKIGGGENCLSCNKDNKCETCNIGYKLMPEGNCKLIDNSFTAVYNSTTITESTRIMCNLHTNFKLTDFDMYIDGKIAIPSMTEDTINSLSFISYKFDSIGLHNVTVLFKITLRGCIGWMFGWCKDLVSIKFSDSFDTTHVNNIYNMFNMDTSLQRIDLSSFDTSHIYEMTDAFWYCNKLTSINLSNFNTSLVQRMEGMFDHCDKLDFIDLSSFNMSKVKDTKSMFYGVNKKGTIKISNLFGEYKNLIPKNWNIIIVE